uniref:DNA 5'-3' helicase n=1 Tax=Gelidium kathyanniae TaxID=2483893 RepID=A0A3G2QY53_9FLOR|nr:replication helicase subunit [Gelidium kathyanniae]AYO27991.1 replication helicase subunit [Gelidium kathyanniae]
MYKKHKYYVGPHNCLAEEILLGSMLIYPNLFPKISKIVQIDSFFLESHQIIYRNLLSLNKENKLDLINLLYILYDHKLLKYIGGITKIIDMMKQSQMFISSININIYAKELVDIINVNYIKRLMIQYGYNIIQLALIKKLPSYLLYNKAAYYLNFTVNKIPKENLDDFKDLIGQFLLKSTAEENIVSYTIKSKKLSYGFKELDKLTNGLSNGDLIIIAGRPSMGKTSFAINIAYNLISKSTIGLCIFSLEMSRNQILNKLISIASKISTSKITSNNITKHEWSLLKTICKFFLRHEVYIYDTPNISIDYIVYTCQILAKDNHSIQVIIIDYLQLIQTEQRYNTNRSQELSYITRKLKILAQQLNIPIIVLSQLNRGIENRINKKPLLSDLRESGCIEYNKLINIDNINLIHFKYLFKYKLYNLIHKTCISKIHISHKYNYKLILNNTTISTTHNHLLLYNNLWLPQDTILEQKLIYKDIKKSIQYIHTLNIYFFKNSQVYDISVPKYRYFTSNNIIVHNSIEQDADIVMILYKDSIDNQIYDYDNSINLDMTICKNRNGPTGLCSFLFYPNSTYFEDLKEKN